MSHDPIGTLRAAWEQYLKDGYLGRLTATLGTVFASPPASPDDTPPEPPTDRARLEAEGWSFEAPPESEVGQMHELLPRDPTDEQAKQTPLCYQGFDGMKPSEPTWGGGAAGWRIMGEDWSVLAWRRAKPLAPSPTAGIEEVKAEVADAHRRVECLLVRLETLEKLAGYEGKRLNELEIKARVMARWVTGDYQLASGETGCDLLMRLEREERERAGK